MSSRFGTQDLLACYRRGVFPMADSRDDPNLFLVDPDMRGILPLDAFHIPRRLKRTVIKDPFRVTADTAFTRVMEFCGEETDGRESTWINSAILNLYSAALVVEANFYSGVGSVSSDGGSSSIIGSSDEAVLRSGSFTGSVAVQRITQTS